MPTWLAIVSSLLSAIVVATVAHFLGRSQESARNRQALRAAAYVHYLRAASAMAIPQRSGDEKVKALTLMIDAKARMCIYGAATTLRALADFERAGANLVSRKGMDAFLTLCEVMRAETGEPGARTDISRILLALDVPEDPPKLDE